MSLETIFDQITAERAYQNRKWGHDFDDKNTVNDWMAYIASYGAKGTTMGADFATQRAAMLKVAALACAAIEAFDRNKGFPRRHYDP